MLDLSDLVVDPDLATTFTVLRRAQTVSSSGIASITVTTFTDVVGVVTPEPVPLVLEPDYTHAQNSITILTQMKLYDPTTGFEADQIVWQGDTYQVRNASGWNQFGYYQANCDMVNLTSAP